MTRKTTVAPDLWRVLSDRQRGKLRRAERKGHDFVVVTPTSVTGHGSLEEALRASESLGKVRHPVGAVVTLRPAPAHRDGFVSQTGVWTREDHTVTEHTPADRRSPNGWGSRYTGDPLSESLPRRTAGDELEASYARRIAQRS